MVDVLSDGHLDLAIGRGAFKAEEEPRYDETESTAVFMNRSRLSSRPEPENR
jgi:alkanesulfonate monooxygenase SsuD/methylene tetrahydromethanopterin reductase-like flavin-dependent oxidoreductase (luciferase family)